MNGRSPTREARRQLRSISLRNTGESSLPIAIPCHLDRSGGARNGETPAVLRSPTADPLEPYQELPYTCRQFALLKQNLHSPIQLSLRDSDQRRPGLVPLPTMCFSANIPDATERSTPTQAERSQPVLHLGWSHERHRPGTRDTACRPWQHSHHDGRDSEKLRRAKAVEAPYNIGDTATGQGPGLSLRQLNTSLRHSPAYQS